MIYGVLYIPGWCRISEPSTVTCCGPRLREKSYTSKARSSFHSWISIKKITSTVYWWRLCEKPGKWKEHGLNPKKILQLPVRIYRTGPAVLPKCWIREIEIPTIIHTCSQSRGECKGEACTPPENNHDIEQKTPFSIGNTSSNGGFFIVILVFGGVDLYVFFVSSL